MGVNILDPRFQYTPSYATDIRRTFERVRRQAQPQRAGVTVLYKPDDKPKIRSLLKAVARDKWGV